MLERQRHQYLSAFGIDQYIPRRLLPGACPSVQLADQALQPLEHQLSVEMPKVSPTEEHQEHHSGTIETSHPTKVDESDPTPISRVLLDDGPKDSLEPINSLEPENKNKLEHTKELTETSKKAVRFVLNIWRVADDCLVIDSRQPATALPTDRLLQNILRAIGYPLAQLPQSEIIRWPIFNQDPLANDAEQARAMVQAFISAQDKKAGLEKIILMGEEATFALDEPDQVFDQLCGQLHSHKLWQAQIAVTPSLHTMLHEPMTKALAWQVLQKF